MFDPVCFSFLCECDPFKTSFDVGRGTIFFRWWWWSGLPRKTLAGRGRQVAEVRSCCESNRLGVCLVVLVTRRMMTQQETEAGSRRFLKPAAEPGQVAVGPADRCVC